MRLAERVLRVLRKQRGYAYLLQTKLKELSHKEIRRCTRQYAKLAALSRRLNSALKQKVRGEV